MSQDCSFGRARSVCTKSHVGLIDDLMIDEEGRRDGRTIFAERSSERLRVSDGVDEVG